jgi:GT2 family glycosyltransferase
MACLAHAAARLNVAVLSEPRTAVTPRISVIVPTHNRGAMLAQAIRALWRQSLAAREIEIIVVDNASSDDTRERVDACRAASPITLRYHRLTADQGPAGARNAGAQIARGSALLFVDSDVELHPEWMRCALRHLDAFPDVGIVGGKLLYAARPSRINMYGGELSRIGLAWDGYEGRETTDVAAPVEKLWAPSSAVLVRRELLDRIGLFDESFYFGFEDSDLGWRANLAGARCHCLPELVAWHLAMPSGRTAGPVIVFHYTKNRLRSMLKNYSLASLATYVPLYLAYSFAELVARPSRRERLRALAWNVYSLRSTWRERQRVQRLRQRRDSDLRAYFASRLLPAKTLACRRREEWLLLRSKG